MKQNNIRGVLEKHQVVPVVTINNEAEVDGIITGLMSKGIFCIEVTLRTPYALSAIELIKAKYGNQISVGVGQLFRKNKLKLSKLWMWILLYHQE